MMEKTLRVLGGEEGHSHSHSHGEEHEKAHAESTGASSAVAGAKTDGLRARGGANDAIEKKVEEEQGKSPSKLSAYLNLFGDFVHNM